MADDIDVYIAYCLPTSESHIYYELHIVGASVEQVKHDAIEYLKKRVHLEYDQINVVLLRDAALKMMIETGHKVVHTGEYFR